MHPGWTVVPHAGVSVEANRTSVLAGWIYAINNDGCKLLSGAGDTAIVGR